MRAFWVRSYLFQRRIFLDKSKLISIGTLSKLTGVHIKSLRYYDRLGILRPAYIDPASGYRYYSFPQIHVVDAIQLCVDLGIPLKQFTDFVGEDGRQIHYGALLARGTELAGAKIRSIQERLQFLHQIEEEFDRGAALQESGGWIEADMPEKPCLALPYGGKLGTLEYYKGITHLFEQVEKLGLKPGYDLGMVMFCRGGERERYLFLALEAAGPLPPDIPGLLRLPGARYRFLRTEEDDIAAAPSHFPDLFAQDYGQTVIQEESILEVSDTAAPTYEVRCSLPAESPG